MQDKTVFDFFLEEKRFKAGSFATFASRNQK
jgi:hypothetical protein